MSVYCDPDKEIIYHILNLLPTVEEALLHMRLQLNELRLEEGERLYKDITEAISKIAYSFMLLKSIDAGNFQKLNHLTGILHESVIRMQKSYDEKNIVTLQAVLTEDLIPAFLDWKQELDHMLRLTILV